MRQKRIAMISFHTCPLASDEGKTTGGMNIYILELSKALAKQGYDVDMYTRNEHPDNEEIIEVIPHLRLIHLRSGPQKQIDKKKLRDLIPTFVEQFHLFTKKHELNYDILHCHYYLSGLIGLDINKSLLHPIPIIMSFHTLALMKNLVAREEQEKENTDRIEAEKILMSQVHKIISPSKYEKEYITYLYEANPKKISVIAPGVDTSHFHPLDKDEAIQRVHKSPDERLLLFVGRIEPLKSIDMIFYALKIVVQKNPDLKLKLWIVGGNANQQEEEWSKQLKALAQLRDTLQLTNFINFIGQLHQKELPLYYNASDIVLMPSHYESFGIVGLEAMACGIPVITTNVTGVSNIITNNRSSLITSVNNPLLLSKQIETLLSNKELYSQTSRELIKNAQKLDWAIIVKEFISLYKSVS
ncbi:MAG: glycosyltransferase [Candidatus Roizmanbacteria bacterium]